MARAATKQPGMRARRRARKQAHILAAARALLRRHGHDRLSLRHVARRAGISPAGMYEFFENREHLVGVLAGEANEALTSALRSAAQGTPDPIGRLVQLGLAYIRFAQARPTDFMLLFGRGSRRRSLAEDVPADSEYGMIRAAVADVVGVGQPDGAFPQFLEALAYGFWSSIHGMAMLQLTHLAGFRADFATAHRFLLESTARSWQSADWTRTMGSAADRTRVL
jgi:AcrR family transcriptional regulator